MPTAEQIAAALMKVKQAGERDEGCTLTADEAAALLFGVNLLRSPPTGGEAIRTREGRS